MPETTPSSSNDNQRPARSGWQRLRDADMIAALAAVVVGVCALAVSIYQSILMREQQQASVWPHLEIGREYRHEGSGHVFKLVVRNTGIGPARLETLRITLNGAHQTGWASTLKSLGLTDDDIQSRATVIGRALLPGNNIEMLVAINDAATSKLEQGSQGDSPALNVEICYCSIYASCYRMSYAGREETPADRCERDPKLDFRE